MADFLNNSSQHSVVVIGDLNVDIVCLTTGQLNVNSDTPSRNRLSVGGSPCNVSAWLSHDAVKHDFYAALGDDALGSWVKTQIAANGLPIEHVTTIAGSRTGSCVVLVSDSGDRTMLPDPGANLELHVDDTMENSIRNSSYVVMSCYSYFRPETRQLALDVQRLCHELNKALVLDAASSAPIAAAEPRTLRDYLRSAWLVVANSEEDAALQGVTDWKLDIPNVVVKSGQDGARWYQSGLVTSQQTAEQVHAVDTTGAGDAFMAGLMSVLHDIEPDEVTPSDIGRALVQGNHNGALCVSHIGAQPVDVLRAS